MDATQEGRSPKRVVHEKRMQMVLWLGTSRPMIPEWHQCALWFHLKHALSVLHKDLSNSQCVNLAGQNPEGD